MADYNPNQPIVLGQEWVPIREENLAFNESVNNVELGHSFTLASPAQLSSGRFYVNKFPTSAMNNQAYTMAVYPKGREDQSGPVKSVIIPCNNAASTGLGSQTGTLDLVTRVSNSSADPDLGIFIGLGTSTVRDIQFFFATNAYATLLAGKRILGCDVIFNRRFTNVSGVAPPNPTMLLTWRNESNTNRWNFPIFADNLVRSGTNNPRTYRLGDVDRFFGGSVANTVDTIPMNYEMLRKFEATAGVSRIHMHINVPGNLLASTGTFVYINYVALQVFYCEETRVAFGTKLYNPWQQTPFLTDSPIMRGIPYQTNPVIFRDLAGNANPILAAGDYVVTLAQANMGDDLEAVSNSGPHAEMNALRQLYEVPSFQGVQVNVPFPLDDNITRIPRTFTSEFTDVLPQLSLHVSGGTPYPQVHVYGRQAAGQVWGNVTVTQDILDSVVGVATTYTDVRFVARRFGDTTVPLTLSSTSPTISGSCFQATITVAEFDALEEILDGWKEVNLTFACPHVLGTGITPQYRWSATGELAGNRWEILGAIAPALSGLPGNNLNLAVPPVSQLGSATYGQPSAGTTVNMAWIPQYSPYVSATTDDTTADAFLMLSQTPPAVSGFIVSVQTQALSGIGQNCGLDPCCVPTELDFNQLTWTASSGPYSVELQRMDTVDTEWQTIMLNTSPASGAGIFNDYEARVGIEASYRIREINSYDFVGPWSATITSTIPEPGVTIGCPGHVLIFTSNEYQDGSLNLAYSNAWEGEVQEAFSFPEASSVQLQAMYDRDFVTAFHSTERGGERFERQILVQAAAISPPTLGDFRGLRDMAWADVPYICVRDEEGNRWFATILVPNGRVVHFRKLYLATIGIVEVTDTPSPVNP